MSPLVLVEEWKDLVARVAQDPHDVVAVRRLVNLLTRSPTFAATAGVVTKSERSYRYETAQIFDIHTKRTTVDTLTVRVPGGVHSGHLRDRVLILSARADDATRTPRGQNDVESEPLPGACSEDTGQGDV